MLALRDRFRARRTVSDRDDRVVDSRDDRVVDDRDRGRGTAGGARRALARLVDLITVLVVALILIGIAFVLLKANPDNTIVGTLRDAAKYLSKPFDAIFEMKKRRTEIAVNWGIAAVVYLAVGRVISRLLAVRSGRDADRVP